MTNLLDELIVEVGVKFNLILVTVCDDIFGPNKFSYTHQLVLVVSTFKEGLPIEHHSGKHAPYTPYIQLVIIVPVSN